MSTAVPSPIAVGHLTNAIRNGGRTTDIRIAEAIGSVAQAVNAQGVVIAQIETALVPAAPAGVTKRGTPVTY